MVITDRKREKLVITDKRMRRLLPDQSASRGSGAPQSPM